MSYHYYQEEINSLPANDPDGFGLAIQIRHQGTGDHTKWLSLTDECKDALRKFIAPKIDGEEAMTEEQRADYWLTNYRRLAKEEETARAELAKLLCSTGEGNTQARFRTICPATWRVIIQTVKELLDSWRLQNGEGS